MKIKFNGIILFAMSLILFAAASNTQSGWQYIISSLLIALLVIGFILPLLQVKKITVNKFLPSRIYAGKDVVVVFSLTNHSNKDKKFFDIIDIPVVIEHDYFLAVREPNLITLLIKLLHKMLEGKKQEVTYFVRSLPAGKSIEFEDKFVPTKRGVYSVGKTTISTSSPLGLFSFSKSYLSGGEVVIYPKILDIRGGWVNRISHKSILRELSYSYIPTSIPGTTRGLREYIPGDSPRHIHWPTSARANKLLVREFEIESSGYVVVILDSSPDFESEEYFELAVTATASLLNACHTEGLLTRFVTQSDAYTYSQELKDDDWLSQLEILARVKNISKQPAINLIDKLNQELISNEPGFSPVYVLVSSTFKAGFSGNKDNIVSITVSSKRSPDSNYTITSDLDLKYI